MKKLMNKAIAAMIMMTIALAMPAKADNRNYVNSGRRDHSVVVNNNKKDAHFDKKDHKPGHIDNRHVYRPDMKTCTIRISHRDSHHKIVAKAERIKGVKDANWNPRTRELTVLYDANKTTARYIKRVLA